MIPPENTTRPIAGVLAEFDSPEALREAAAAARAEGYVRLEAYSPLPVHGLDAALGRRRTRLPWLVLGGGVAGGLGAILLQWWTNAVDYPLVISGKPFFSLPANIPIAFELVILLAALAAFLGGLVLGGLPRLAHPLAAADGFRRVTTDSFFLAIEAADPRFDSITTPEWLRSQGASQVDLYHEPAGSTRVPGVVISAVAMLAVLALIPPLWIAKTRHTRSDTPRLNLVSDMDFQPKYLPQQGSGLFADGRAMRPDVPATLASDAPIDDEARAAGTAEGKPLTRIPLPVSEALMARGRERFDVYCATCHGLAGQGDGITSQLAFEREEPKWVRPTVLTTPAVRDQPVGQLFGTISRGVRTMPGYASQIPTDDRWAIVLYIRALQRSHNATLEEVPAELRKHLEEQRKAILEKEKKKEPRMNADERR